jgi:hypothetical protein
MTDKYFEFVRGGFSLHMSADEEYTAMHFVLARFGESPDRVLEVFYKEHPIADFMVVPLFAYGLPPRRELCTARSLSAALQSVSLDVDGVVTRTWKELCQEFDVAWPRRLSRLSEKAA